MRSSIIIIFGLLTMMSFGCEKNEKDCVAQQNDDCVCIQLYQPVCGCDGITYSNGCMAACVGIEVVSEGECNKEKSLTAGDFEFLGYEVEDKIDIDNPVAKHSFPANTKFGSAAEGHELTGRSGVNYFNGSYSTTDANNELDIQISGSTKMAGTDEANAFEQKFWNSMNEVTKYTFKGELLLLTFKVGSKSDNMVFKIIK